jgi:hypothetical protein
MFLTTTEIIIHRLELENNIALNLYEQESFHLSQTTASEQLIINDFVAWGLHATSVDAQLWLFIISE